MEKNWVGFIFVLYYKIMNDLSGKLYYGVIGIRTWGYAMEGIDNFIGLWCLPRYEVKLDHFTL